MFEKFGEFDSAKEINECAAGLKDEGDEQSLYALAEENGLAKEDVEDYLDGSVDELCNTLTAAIGKIEVEAEQLKPQQIMVDWIGYINTRCVVDEQMMIAVRKKGKSLKGCIGAILKDAFAHQMTIDKDIVKEAGVKADEITLGMPGVVRVNEIIKEYYLGE